jgi:hypothetical protein
MGLAPRLLVPAQTLQTLVIVWLGRPKKAILKFCQKVTFCLYVTHQKEMGVGYVAERAKGR